MTDEVKRLAMVGVSMLVGIFGVGGALLAFGPWEGGWALVPCAAGALSGLGLVIVNALWSR